MKYEALCDLGLMCEVGIKSIAFDLKDSYHAINLAPEILKYVCFKVGGSITVTTCCRLGLKLCRLYL